MPSLANFFSGTASPEKIQLLNERLMQVESNWARSCRHSWTALFQHLALFFAIHLCALGIPGLTEAVEKQDWKLAREQTGAARRSCAEKHEIAEICTIFLGEGNNNEFVQIIFACCRTYFAHYW